MEINGKFYSEGHPVAWMARRQAEADARHCLNMGAEEAARAGIPLPAWYPLERPSSGW